MKAIILLLSTLLFSTIGQSTCDDNHKAEKSAKMTKAAPYTKLIKVEGMTCGGCVKSLSAALKEIQLDEGIKFIVDINRVTIDYSAHKNLSTSELDKIQQQTENVIIKAKYKVVKDQV
ncbi:MAG: heavy-metal-associated domain-containing protein [Bdellovibrionales bacterium]|nr:heavy-metal-associated domain-containing protein [Bdellovibrionales bacterium]